MEQRIIVEYFRNHKRVAVEINNAERLTLLDIFKKITEVFDLHKIHLAPDVDIFLEKKIEENRPDRSYFLQKAHKLIHKDRNNSYGEPIDNFERIAMGWNIIVNDSKITPEKVALMMVWLKIARLVKTPNDVDGYTDICGYASIAGELANHFPQNKEEEDDDENKRVKQTFIPGHDT
tara:strand:+ start:2344 stop:2874 length:531 start_codon:yes stop_codon:yes gene_type:complete